MSDRGLTHVALPVTDLDASLAFWSRYAALEPVHERCDPGSGTRVAWISDRTRPFVVVLIELEEVRHPLAPIAHLGIGCATREEVDRRVADAREAGVVVVGPSDSPYPVGYWALLLDPDGHTLELSHGQEVALTVERPEPGPAAGPEPREET